MSMPVNNDLPFSVDVKSSIMLCFVFRVFGLCMWGWGWLLGLGLDGGSESFVGGLTWGLMVSETRVGDLVDFEAGSFSLRSFSLNSCFFLSISSSTLLLSSFF